MSKEYKKFLVFICIFIFSLFFLLSLKEENDNSIPIYFTEKKDENYTESKFDNYQEKHIIEEKVIEENLMPILPVDDYSEIENETTKVIDHFIIEKKEKILYTTYDNSQRYTIKLKSKNTITKMEEYRKDLKKYIPFSGTINNSNKKAFFSLSLDSNYINYIDDVVVEVQDITKENHIYICKGSFFYNLQLDTIYNLELNIKNEVLDCSLNIAGKLPNIKVMESSEVNSKKEIITNDLDNSFNNVPSFLLESQD